jgi:hypothetical protein
MECAKIVSGVMAHEAIKVITQMMMIAGVPTDRKNSVNESF